MLLHLGENPGLVAAARPIITAAQPVSRTMRAASSGLLMSPLPMTEF